MSTGWEAREAILRRDAEEKVLSLLRTHGWKASIDAAVEKGEYLLISAERGGQEHRIALLYTSQTSNDVYRRLDQQVECILVNGQLTRVGTFARGISTPVVAAHKFFAVLVEWNEASGDGKFAPTSFEEGDVERGPRAPEHRLLLSEEPITAIWLRLRQFQSVTLATKLIADRARRGAVDLDGESIRSKAEGVAYALRNAGDSFQGEARSVSQRVVNLYYGSLAFAFAEMLASPAGPTKLVQIEKETKYGHGLYTVDGSTDALGHLVVGHLNSGFFPFWMKFMGLALVQVPSKPRENEELRKVPAGSWLTMEQLFSRIPVTGQPEAFLRERARGRSIRRGRCRAASGAVRPRSAASTAWA